MSKHKIITHGDLSFSSKKFALSLLITHDPYIDSSVWKKAAMEDLAHWMFHTSLYDVTIDKIAANIAARLRTRTTKKQLAFLKKHNYFSPYNLLLAAKIIRGLMKAPAKNFAIVRKLEESYFTTREQRILLWSHVFDGIPRNRSEKSYALFRVCQMLPFATTVKLNLIKRPKKDREFFQTLRIAA